MHDDPIPRSPPPADRIIWQAIDAALSQLNDDHVRWIQVREEAADYPQAMVEAAQFGHERYLQVLSTIPRRGRTPQEWADTVRARLDSAAERTWACDPEYEGLGRSSLLRAGDVLKKLILEHYHLPSECRWNHADHCLHLRERLRRSRWARFDWLPRTEINQAIRRVDPQPSEAYQHIVAHRALLASLPDFKAFPDLPAWWQAVDAWLAQAPQETAAQSRALSEARAQVNYQLRRAEGHWS